VSSAALAAVGIRDQNLHAELSEMIFLHGVIATYGLWHCELLLLMPGNSQMTVVIGCH